ncbi:MAG TPA: bifunctional riboflavin kinase/FMN adenylyltransferase [Phycisphaerales bacterium]|nr:bifunctional riboflavin kinase/FMN adenylyltransferase [Phycisphaerales bacterium]
MRPAPTIVTVGNFDGVHAGHAAILRRARELAAERNAGGGVVALAFDPHPATRLAPERAPERLTTFEERAELLRRAGADRVERLAPTDELLGLSPEAFVEWVGARHNPRAFVEGADFRFGRGRAGDVQTLRGLGDTRGFGVDVVRPVAAALSDHTVVTASSTMTRWLLGRGRVRDAWSVLGRPHALAGTVVRGDRRGRELGFPTANLDTPNMLPADGVYAAVARLPNGSGRPAALSVGAKPQFNGVDRTAEAFILDAGPGLPHLPGLPEYGWPLRLELVGWVREQMRFDGVERLVEQIGRDCDRVREMVESLTQATLQAHAVTQ